MSTFIQYAILGLGIGGIYALLTQGLIVIYGGSGVLNLAHGAMAMIGGYLYWQFRYLDGWQFVPAFAVAVLATAGIGVLTYQLVMRPLKRASSLARVVATLGLLVTLQGCVALSWDISPRVLPIDLPHSLLSVGSVVIPEDRLWLVGIGGLLTLGIWLLYRFTRLGLAIRAASANQRGVSALGWSANLLATVTWGFGAGLAGVGGVLITPLVGLSVDQLPLLIVPVLAAALVGGFTSFWLTFIGAILIGVVQSLLAKYIHFQGIEWSLPFGVIVLLLVVRGKTLPVRGFFAERLPKVGTGRIAWPALIPIVGVSCWLLLDVFQGTLLDALTTSFTWAMLMLSAVVLLGFTSQLSFEQMAMAGLATLICSRLVAATGIPFGFAALIALLAAVPIGAAFALPALRTRGINLAVVTLGLGALIVEMVLTNQSVIGFGGSGIPVPLPRLFGIAIDAIQYPNRYATLTFIMFVLAALAIANIRRGKSGSALIAVRTNERAAAALGINVLTTKLFAFLVGSTVAAAGGILFAFRSPVIVFDEFTPFNSILVVSYAVIGGVGYIMGPVAAMTIVAGGLGHWILTRFYTDAYRAPHWLILLGGVFVLKILVLNPDGFVELKTKVVKAPYLLLRRLLRIPVRPHVPEPLPEAPAHMAERATLEIKGLTVRFGGVTAVDRVSMTVRPQEVVGLIGPNGAGKTTVIDAVTGFVPPAEGEFLVNGTPIGTWAVHRRVRAGLSRSFQSLELFEDSTVRENLRVASDPKDFHKYFADVIRPGHRPLSAAAAAAVHEFALENDLDTLVSDLPYGRRRLVAIARAIAVDPSILLLDEPAAGLSAAETADLALVIRRLANEWGFGVLVIEHDMTFVMGLCDRITVIDFGKQIAEGSPEQIRNDPAVIAAYLGEPEPAPVPTAS